MAPTHLLLTVSVCSSPEVPLPQCISVLFPETPLHSQSHQIWKHVRLPDPMLFSTLWCLTAGDSWGLEIVDDNDNSHRRAEIHPCPEGCKGKQTIPTLWLLQQFSVSHKGGGGHFSSIFKEMVNKVFLKTQRIYSGVFLIQKFGILFFHKMDSPHP